MPLLIPASGESVRIEPPRLAATLPTEADAGHLDVIISASDEGAITAMTAWWDYEKIAWQSGESSTAELIAPVVVGGGHHTLTVEVIDDQGAKTTRRYHVQGRIPDGAADEE